MQLWTIPHLLLETLGMVTVKVKDLSFLLFHHQSFLLFFIILFIYLVFNTQVQTHGYAGSVQGKIWDCIYGLSLHGGHTQGVMWSVIGGGFFIFCLLFYYYYYIFIFFLYSQTNYCSPGSIWGFASLPPTV